jgi:small-conductance mechanosensitive channel
MGLLGAVANQHIVAHPLTLADGITAAALVVIGVVIGQLAKRLSVRVIRRGDSDRLAAEALGRTVGLVVFVAALVYSLGIVGVRLGPLVGALGIGGVAIAFAAQNILANFLASITLQVRRPFRRGDQITTNGQDGTVEDVNFRTVVLRTYDGERVLVPCAKVLSEHIANHTTLGRRRTSIELSIGVECDLDDVRERLIDAARGVDGVLPSPSPEVWVHDLLANSATLCVRFWHRPDAATLWRVRSHVAVACQRALADAGVAFSGTTVELRLPGDAPGVSVREAAFDSTSTRRDDAPLP